LVNMEPELLNTDVSTLRQESERLQLLKTYKNGLQLGSLVNQTQNETVGRFLRNTIHDLG